MFRTAASSLLRSAAPSPLATSSPLRSLAHPTSLRLLQQRRLLSDDARKKIDQVVQQNPLVLFMKGTPDLPQCGFSRAVCQILEVQGVPPEKLMSFNCLEDNELREGIKEYSSWPTIPQLYVQGEFIGGCDIVLQMHQSGELEKLLAEAKVVVEEPGAEA